MHCTSFVVRLSELLEPSNQMARLTVVPRRTSRGQGSLIPASVASYNEDLPLIRVERRFVDSRDFTCASDDAACAVETV